MIFSGMSGSALADAAGPGKLEVDMMLKAGYQPGFAAALTAASAIIGPIIPPSIPMVLYGVVSNTSIGYLFMGGVVPGLLLALAHDGGGGRAWRGCRIFRHEPTPTVRGSRRRDTRCRAGLAVAGDLARRHLFGRRDADRSGRRRRILRAAAGAVLVPHPVIRRFCSTSWWNPRASTAIVAITIAGALVMN